jgi:tripartite-type tricarboxylate transporter receptor subunit TctC
MIPFGPGGGYDWYTRTLAPLVSEQLSNNPEVVAENVEGGGGLVATNQLWNAEPDGYTYLLRHGQSSVWQQIGLPDQAEFDVREFTDLMQIAVSLYGFVRHPDTDPIETWDDLVTLVQNGRVGTGGVGDAPHLFSIIVGNATGAWSEDDLDFVHYEGFGDSMSGMDRGEIELTIGGLTSSLEYIEGGVCEPVVTLTTESRDEWDAPSLDGMDVPEASSIADSCQAPRIFSAPPDVPEDIADTLSQALIDAAESDEFVEAAEENERPIEVLNREEASQLTESMYETWSEQEDLLRDVLQ